MIDVGYPSVLSWRRPSACLSARIPIRGSRHSPSGRRLQQNPRARATDISWGGNKITSYGTGSTPDGRADVPQVGQVQDGAFLWGGTSGGSADAQTLTITPALVAHAPGLTVRSS
jgi:hypothetical protein